MYHRYTYVHRGIRLNKMKTLTILILFLFILSLSFLIKVFLYYWFSISSLAIASQSRTQSLAFLLSIQHKCNNNAVQNRKTNEYHHLKNWKIKKTDRHITPTYIHTHTHTEWERRTTWVQNIMMCAHCI